MSPDTELQIRIALFCTAVPVGMEAVKSERFVRIGLWAFTALLILTMVFLKPLVDLWPAAGAAAASIAGNPSSWFFLACVFFIVGRQFLQRSPALANPQQAPMEVDDKAERNEPRLAALEERLAEIGRIADAAKGECERINQHVRNVENKLWGAEETTYNVARIEKLKAALSELDEASEKLDAGWLSQSSRLLPGAQPGGNPYATLWDESLERIRRIYNDVTGKRFDAGGHPHYTLNPMRVVPGDEQISDLDKKQQFRLLYDRHHTAKSGIYLLLGELRAELVRRERGLQNYGNPRDNPGPA